MRHAVLVLFMLVLWPALGMACGAESDCRLGERHYRISSADQAGNGAIVFVHGYRGTAEGTMRNMNMRRMVEDMGLALIAVKSLRQDWAIPNAPGNIDSDGSAEFTYFEDVLADAETRFGLDRERVMVAGFSAGGMMVWELACKRPGLFAGYLPIAGTFWKGPPESCAAPVNLVHIHGTADRTVPLEGRQIQNTRQGSISETLTMYRDLWGFEPVETVRVGKMDCAREASEQGATLEFCTHPGGHSFSRNYLSYGWDRITAAGAL